MDSKIIRKKSKFEYLHLAIIFQQVLHNSFRYTRPLYFLLKYLLIQKKSRVYASFFTRFVSLFLTILLGVNIVTGQTILTTIPLVTEDGNEVSPEAIGVNQTTNRIYVGGLDQLFVIDGETNKIIDSVTIDNLQGVQGVGVNPTTNRIYINNLANSTVKVIDGETNQIIDTITVDNESTIDGRELLEPASLPPRYTTVGIGVNPITNRIYVANLYQGTLNIIDGENNDVIDTITVTDPLDINNFDDNFVGFLNAPVQAVRVNPITNHIYVAGSFDVTIIDGETNQIIETITVNTSSQGGLRGIGVNPITNLIYVANFFDNTVSVIDGNTNQVIDTIIELDTPHGVEVNPSTNVIYVVNALDDIVSVIDGRNNQVIGFIDVEGIEIGINATTSRIYLLGRISERVVTVIQDKEAETPVITSLAVSPTLADSSLILKEAVVLALDQESQPISGITVNASANGLGAKVKPTFVTTSVDGTAKFEFRFGFVTKDGKITFTANDLTATISQE